MIAGLAGHDDWYVLVIFVFATLVLVVGVGSLIVWSLGDRKRRGGYVR